VGERHAGRASRPGNTGLQALRRNAWAGGPRLAPRKLSDATTVALDASACCASDSESDDLARKVPKRIGRGGWVKSKG
jgi:hypothetical protein